MNNIQLYEGSSITFDNKDGKLMVNATQMAGHFGKKPYDWLRTQPAKEYISEFASVSHICETDLVQVVQGGEPGLQGTWMHEDVALCFAQWLSPKFYIWCNQRIKELMQTGHTEIRPLTRKELALQVLAAEEEIERLALLNKEYKSANDELAEKNSELDDLIHTLFKNSHAQPIKAFASNYGMTSAEMNKILHSLHIQYKIGNSWYLYKEHMNKGYEWRDVCHNHLQWTAKGVTFLYYELSKIGRFPVSSRQGVIEFLK